MRFTVLDEICLTTQPQGVRRHSEGSGVKRIAGLTAAILAAVLVLTGSCKVSARPGYIEDDKKATAQAIAEFHRRLSAAQFDDIYREAHQAFRDTGSREQLFSAMRATRDRFGAFKKVTFSQLNVF